MHMAGYDFSRLSGNEAFGHFVSEDRVHEDHHAKWQPGSLAKACSTCAHSSRLTENSRAVLGHIH